MGHLQKMTPSQRSKFTSKSYKAMIEARRGHNYSYLTDDLYKDLLSKGYREYKEKENMIHGIRSEEIAKGIVADLRSMGNYARIVCIANRLRIKEFHVYSKPKK